MYKIFFSGILFFTLESFSLVAAADPADLAYGKLIKEAQQALESNDYEKAATFFSKAYILNPHLKISLENLQNLSQFNYSKPAFKALLVLINDQLSYQVMLEKKINYLKAKRDALKSILVQNGLKEEVLEDKLTSLGQDIQKNQFVSLEIFDSPLMQKDEPLSSVNISLDMKNQGLHHELATLQQQFEFLKNVQQYAWQETLTKKSPQPVPERMAKTQQEDIDFLKSEMGSVHENIADLKILIEEKDSKIESLNRQVVDLSLKLSEKDLAMNHIQLNGVLENDQISKIKSQMELSQEIIKDKNEEILSLRKRLQEYKERQTPDSEELGGYSPSTEEKLIELAGILQIYKEEFYDAKKDNKEKKQDVALLETRVQKIRAKLYEKDRIIKETRGRISVLEDQLKSMQDELEQMKGASQRIPHVEHLSDSQELKNIRDFLLDNFQSHLQIEPISINDLHVLNELMDMKQ